MKLTKKNILIGLGLVAAASAAYFMYEIYFILETFAPNRDTAEIPIEVVEDDTIKAGEEISIDPPKTQPQNWADGLNDLGNGQFLDYNNDSIYTLDSDGNYVDASNNVIDDATGEVLLVIN